MKLILIIVFIILLLLYIGFIIFNSVKKIKLQKNREKITKLLEYNLKEKWNLIPKYIKLTQQIEANNKHIEKLIILKNRLYNKLTLKEKLTLNQQLTKEINDISQNSEKILNNNQEFLQLNDYLLKIENTIDKLEKEYTKSAKYDEK